MEAEPLARWQRARGFENVWFQREDELGGTKRRKYASLIPALLKRNVTRVRLRGSSHSNNVLQLSLALREAGIEPFYAVEGRPGPPTGNNRWIRMVLGPNYLESEELLPPGLPELPEGAACDESWEGALTLAAGVEQNCLRYGFRPDRIVIDAGTGFTAAALVAGLQGGHVCVLQLAGDTGWQQRLPAEARASFEVWRPTTARSFGSVNAAVRREVERMAREEGILVDPVYTAKLCLETRKRPCAGTTLIVLGGGTLSLMGFSW